MAQPDYQDENGNWYQPDNPWQDPQPYPGDVWDWPSNDWVPPDNTAPPPEAPYTPPAPTPTPTPAPPPTVPPPGAPPPPRTPPPFGGVFRPPTPQPYPTLPGIPNAPIPTLPTIPQAPAFQYEGYAAPTPFSYEDFKAPTVEQALSDPSYQFRKQQGEDSLQRWAAARGTLNDSGTAKALIDYGGNSASQEYSNIWGRDLQGYLANRSGAMDTYNTNERNRAETYNTNRAGAVQQYNTNYQTQYADPYKAAYQTAIDSWIPQQEQWREGIGNDRLGYSTQFGATQADNTRAYDQAWQRYLDEWKRWKNGPLDDQAWDYGTMD